MKTAVSACLGVAVAFVVVYAYLILPLDLGLGLAEGYRELGSLSFGLATSAVWLILTLLLGWAIIRAHARSATFAKGAWAAALGASLTLLASYPLVVLYMYTALDAALPTGQIGVSVGMGKLYWVLLAASTLCLLIAPLMLARISRQDRRD